MEAWPDGRDAGTESTMVMETQQYLDQLAQNAERLADAAAAAGTEAAVPTCPEWTVTDLLQHCTRGDAWARTIVEQGRAGSTERVLPGEVDTSIQGEALLEAFRGGARSLVDDAAVGDPGHAGLDVLVDQPHRLVLAAATVAGDLDPPLRRRGRRGDAVTDSTRRSRPTASTSS